LWVFAGSVWVLGEYCKPGGHSSWVWDLVSGRFCAEIWVFEEFLSRVWEGPGSRFGQNTEAK
jgi:hypothetical protein